MSKPRSKEKSPYRRYSVEEVMDAENGNYVIQVGGDLFSYNGKMAFSKARADKFYDNVMAGLHDLKKHGSDVEQDDAIKCLFHLKVFPLRIN